MKSKLMTMTLFMLAPLFLSAHPTTNDDKASYNLPHDNTDIHTNPLDTSDEEEEMEEDQLDEIERDEENKNK